MRWLILLLFPVIGSAAIHSGPAPSTTDQLPPIADGTIIGNTSGSTAAPSALTSPTITSINATSTTAPFQYGGVTWAWFPVNGVNAISATLLGLNAGKGLSITSTAVNLTTSVGYNSGGALGAGMTGGENTFIGWDSGAFCTTCAFNTALGVNTMGAETTGSGNVALGEDAMRDTVGELNSTAVGSNAGRNQTCTACTMVGYEAMWGGSGTTANASTISNDTAIGYLTLQGSTSTTGGNNTAVGASALKSPAATTAHDNTAVGLNSLSSNTLTTASFNVAVGSGALQTLATGNSNTLVGTSAGSSLDAVSSITGVGSNALQFNTSGSNNVAVGTNASQNSTADTTSVAIGMQALQGQTSSTGNENIAIGFNTMGNNTRTSAGSNLAIGDRSMQTITSGSNNVALGWHAGQVITTGSNNVIIGQNVASTTLTTGGNNVIIGTTSSCDAGSSGQNTSVHICAGSTDVFTVTAANTPSTSVSTVAGTLTAAAGIVVPNTVVGSLPTCNAGAKGQMWGVTDASSPTYNATLTGGSSTYALAVCNGTNWTAH